MKHFLSMAALLATVTTAPAAFASEAGSCHFHGAKPAKEDTVIGCANQRRDALIANGKLSKSWQALKYDQAVMVDGKNGKEWKVTFKDATAQDKSKETLYLFFTAPGNFIAANHSGK